jgi:predicted GIY-YIG superfamily endonuclease
MFIYILRLQQNKYYIGKSINPAIQLNTHFTNKGLSWTKKISTIRNY